MALTPDEIDRYARHLVLRDVGGPGQARLKAARVLVIGAGGRGAPPIQHLATGAAPRHLLLRGGGGPGRARLKAARVLVIGAGGLGAPLIQYLAAAGIGTVGIVDDATVSPSHLPRPVIHGPTDRE